MFVVVDMIVRRDKIVHDRSSVLWSVISCFSANLRGAFIKGSANDGTMISSLYQLLPVTPPDTPLTTTCAALFHFHCDLGMPYNGTVIE